MIGVVGYEYIFGIVLRDIPFSPGEFALQIRFFHGDYGVSWFVIICCLENNLVRVLTICYKTIVNSRCIKVRNLDSSI
jgi:hypothetical protein